MDVHSRFSQFDNKRHPKSGPQSLKPRLMDPKDPQKAQLPRKASTSSSTSATNATLLIRRPIATNSRIKQDEKTRKDMFLSFVNNALQQKLLGNTEPFDELVNQFNPKRSSNELPFPQPAQLRLWIMALSHVVSRLERTHAALVESIVNMPWTTMDTATVKSYTVFIGVLLSARPEYLSMILSKIAQGFVYQSAFQSFASVDAPSSTISHLGEPPLTRRMIYDRLHYLLRHLLSLIPTLPSTLMPLLARNFPHKRQNTRSQSTYIKNLLKVCWYCPELSDGIIELVVDRAIQIDVEIQCEIDDIEAEMGNEAEATQLSSEIFDIDLDTAIGQETSDAESDSDDSEDDDDGFSDLSSEGGDDLDNDKPKAELPMDVKHIAEMVKKLDAILTLVFEHLERFSGLKSSLLPPSSSSTTLPLNTPPTPLPELPSLDLPSAVSIGLGTPPPTVRPEFLSQSRSPTPTLTPITKDPPLTPITAPSGIASDAVPSRSRMQAHFHTLLSIFDRLILRTFKSRYTQFLLFWYTSLDVEFADIFMGMLVERALYSPSSSPHGLSVDPDSKTSTTTGTLPPAITRAAAASYIGSFVSRARVVDGASARRVVGVLCEWLEAHLDAVERLLLLSSSSGLSASSSTLSAIGTQNSVFHAVAQAVFLIFCFRWRDLLVDDDDSDALPPSSNPSMTAFRDPTSSSSAGPGPGQKWLPQLNVVKRVVTSVLNPLRACSPAVAGQFARIAHATDFTYCYSILESNKRGGDGEEGTSARKSMLGGVDGELNAELNTFFPFDPYALPRSNRFIEDKYRAWKDVAIDDEDEDEEDEEDEDDDSTDADENPGAEDNMSVSVGQDGTGKLGITSSFDAMSISPARPGVQAASILHGP
ncbi:DNA independent RNA polymerase I transcription factor [Marasmius tenuissimus]|uniref:DNA independent RNA polymerase I transcription factor n=1 Tax=Marasmius tenuissimus TaxID=585030 RepID=A0ABR2ZE60_9AGAR